jgi:hypothetical protein
MVDVIDLKSIFFKVSVQIQQKIYNKMVAEWSKATDCKSVEIILHGFKSHSSYF